MIYGIHGIKTRNSVNSDNKCLYVKIYAGSFAFKKVKVFWVRRYLNLNHFLKSIGQLREYFSCIVTLSEKTEQRVIVL
jgi:hypothetical protein